MIQYYIKKDGQMESLPQAEVGCWINISPPFTNEELEEVSATYDIPLDFLTDSLDVDERSRYEKEEDVRLIVINAPIKNDFQSEIASNYVTIPIGIILTVDHIVTISSHGNVVLNSFVKNAVKHFDPSNECQFVLKIFEQTVFHYLRCLKQLNLKRNLIEQELYDSSRSKDLKELLSIEKSLVFFVNSLSSNELLKMKMKRTDFLRIQQNEDLTDFFEDIIIDNSQALEMANVYTNILNGTMDAYSSIISNNLNKVIQRLTLVTIILMVPTLVASFFGMNVPVPFEKTNSAFLFIIIVSAVISLLIVWYFQRKRMF